MAKELMGPNGGWLNKFGKTVGFRWKGLDVFRVYVKPNNPKTQEQVLNRERFGLVGYIAGALHDVLTMTMRSFAAKHHTVPQAQFVKQNYDKTSGTVGNVVIDYETLEVTPSDSRLTTVALGEVDASTPLTVSVPVDDSYLDTNHNSANDKLYLVVLAKKDDNGNEAEVTVSDGTATRSSQNVSVRVPGFWQGRFTEVYAFLAADEMSVRAGQFSKTMYCGTVRIA